MTTPTMEAAVRLAERGIAVFPLRPRTKQPYGRTVGLHMASADVRTARERWAGRWMLPLQPIEKLREKNPGKSDDWLLQPVKAQPSANVAVATGAPAGFWVLDEDGPEASAWIAAREAEHGPLPETVEQQTARGRHRCFLWNDEAAAADISNRSQLSGAPLDVRGEGGYIVVAPSIHPGDAKKGVPPGFVYRWRPGHAPWEMDFAPAPAWLIDLVKPKEAPVQVEVRPHVRVEGRASAYGEAALDRAVATIQAARVGSRDSTLYSASCSIGRLVAGGEIDEAYARSALENAGRVHVPSAMSEAQLIRQVDRALAFGAMNPKSADHARQQTGGVPRRAEGAKTPKTISANRSINGTATDARGLWVEADPADVGLVRAWLKVRGLSHDGAWAKRALAGLRAHAHAPLDRNAPEVRGPALLAPLTLPGHEADAPDALAILPLIGGRGHRGADRFSNFIGDPTARACVLTPAEPFGSVLVTIDLQDAWALASEMEDTDDVMGVAVAPTLSGFCGGPSSDKYQRVDPVSPRADPACAPWMLPRMGAVWLAVRGDLVTPELKVRKVGGGTKRVQLRGGDAARFCGSLAEQAWKRPVADGGGEANRVRLLAPPNGVDFHTIEGAA
ncbi:bifunctional DNA primase/polymerase [Brevundimonas aurantiaca]|uniref:bifunctional DNA primase/polymerase n=1 Tax=Brevundimonas aurantiaca TaxID=74316 RepID=UPI003017DAD5